MLPFSFNSTNIKINVDSFKKSILQLINDKETELMYQENEISHQHLPHLY